MQSIPSPLIALYCFSAVVSLAHSDHEHAAGTTDIMAHASDLGAVSMSTVGNYRVIESKDLPQHETGKFPNRGNPNAITEQRLYFRVPLTPTRAERPIDYDGYVFGVAVNGVPFDPGTAGTWQNNREWREEAIVEGKPMRLGVDQNNAHVQPNGMYHYHGIPWGLINDLRKNNPKAGVDEPLLIGWAADGYPIYFQEGVQSSWRLKTSKRETQPNGPGGERDGLYTRDYEYVDDSGDLDWLNGRYGITDEYPDGTYQYYVTEGFPFVARYFLGQPNESFAKPRQGQVSHGRGGRGPGGAGPEGRPIGPPVPLGVR
ncbi:YHYH protein [Cerasicoccus arenae]|uniref:YHYH domain-containing protein n=1 Tax=Cerasicoccus arenae TaxID=424488 RepID=A0A8J3DFD5_9BACT|nr:YHYH protein [Cerasicoccus arenae]MBK1859020.1 YHYH protein [Cerasicoccus arenae]GHB94757.1 hypothetical protein GCM10007047_07860 [Cerasicoccus arenae]